MSIEQSIGYTFKEKGFLNTALTHSSYSNEYKRSDKNNERLEFLGDSVLSIVVSEYLYKNLELAEGDLTKLRASIVCEGSLAKFASDISLGAELKLGRGEQQSGGSQRPSILADAFEALIGAVYLDGGIDEVKKFLIPFFKDIAKQGEVVDFRDYKTQLQEIVQKNPEEKVQYVLVDENGPDHKKSFTVELRLNSNVIGVGEGRSKKSAEQMAAKQALELMGK